VTSTNTGRGPAPQNQALSPDEESSVFAFVPANGHAAFALRSFEQDVRVRLGKSLVQLISLDSNTDLTAVIKTIGIASGMSWASLGGSVHRIRLA
jgi:hypothetical protein